MARVEQWTVHMLHSGYHIPFHHPFSLTPLPLELPLYPLGSDLARALQEEVDKMLKGTVDLVNDHVSAFYSRLSLIEKVTRLEASD